MALVLNCTVSDGTGWGYTGHYLCVCVCVFPIQGFEQFLTWVTSYVNKTTFSLSQ